MNSLSAKMILLFSKIIKRQEKKGEIHTVHCLDACMGFRDVRVSYGTEFIASSRLQERVYDLWHNFSLSVPLHFSPRFSTFGLPVTPYFLIPGIESGFHIKKKKMLTGNVTLSSF